MSTEASTKKSGTKRIAMTCTVNHTCPSDASTCEYAPSDSNRCKLETAHGRCRVYTTNTLCSEHAKTHTTLIVRKSDVEPLTKTKKILDRIRANIISQSIDIDFDEVEKVFTKSNVKECKPLIFSVMK